MKQGRESVIWDYCKVYRLIKYATSGFVGDWSKTWGPTEVNGFNYFKLKMQTKIPKFSRTQMLNNLKQSAVKQLQEAQELSRLQLQESKELAERLKAIRCLVQNSVKHQHEWSEIISQRGSVNEPTYESNANVMFQGFWGDTIPEGTFEGIRQHKVEIGYSVSTSTRRKRTHTQQQNVTQKDEVTLKEQTLESQQTDTRDGTDSNLRIRAPKKEERQNKRADKQHSKQISELLTDLKRNVQKPSDSEWLTFVDTDACICRNKCKEPKVHDMILEEINNLTNGNNLFENSWHNRLRIYQHVTKCSWQAQCYAREVFEHTKKLQQEQAENIQRKRADRFAKLKSAVKKGGWQKGGRKGPQKLTKGFFDTKEEYLKPKKDQTYCDFEEECIKFFQRTPAKLVIKQGRWQNYDQLLVVKHRQDCEQIQTALKDPPSYEQSKDEYWRTRFIDQPNVIQKAFEMNDNEQFESKQEVVKMIQNLAASLVQDLDTIIRKRLRDQACRHMKKLIRFEMPSEFPFVYQSLEGLSVSFDFFNAISVSWKMKTNKRDGIDRKSHPNCTWLAKQLGWYADQSKALLFLTEKLICAADTVDQFRCEKIRVQANKGMKNFESALYCLEDLTKEHTWLKSKAPKYRCRLNNEQIILHNRLAAQIGAPLILTVKHRGPNKKTV